MKKILIILTILIISNIAFSQVFSGYGFKGGLVSAYLSERLSYDENSSYPTASRLGISLGIFGEFFKSKAFSSILEIDFVQKGGNDRQIYPDVVNHYWTLNLLSIPILAKLSTQFRIFHPYISAGPRVDILLNSNNGVRAVLTQNNVNFGLLILAGAEIEISKKNSILLEAGYSPDLSTYKAQFGNLLDVLIIRNIAWEFKTGLKFNY